MSTATAPFQERRLGDGGESKRTDGPGSQHLPEACEWSDPSANALTRFKSRLTFIVPGAEINVHVQHQRHSASAVPAKRLGAQEGGGGRGRGAAQGSWFSRGGGKSSTSWSNLIARRVFITLHPRKQTYFHRAVCL